jgi:hypothetical protein
VCIGFRRQSISDVTFPVRYLNRSILALPVLLLAVAVAGCGGGDDGGSGAPADDPEIVAAVTDKIGQAALEIANATRDRHLPGPYQLKTVCLSPEQAANSGTSRDAVQCHIEAFTIARKGRKQAYVWSEDWRVPVQDGKLGAAEIVGDYRIKNYLTRDNRLGCSAGQTPQERCTGEYRQPGGQSGVGQGPPTSDGQQEVPIQP